MRYSWRHPSWRFSQGFQWFPLQILSQKPLFYRSPTGSLSKKRLRWPVLFLQLSTTLARLSTMEVGRTRGQVYKPGHNSPCPHCCMLLADECHSVIYDARPATHESNDTPRMRPQLWSWKGAKDMEHMGKHQGIRHFHSGYCIYETSC